MEAQRHGDDKRPRAQVHAQMRRQKVAGTCTTKGTTKDTGRTKRHDPRHSKKGTGTDTIIDTEIDITDTSKGGSGQGCRHVLIKAYTQ